MRFDLQSSVRSTPPRPPQLFARLAFSDSVTPILSSTSRLFTQLSAQNTHPNHLESQDSSLLQKQRRVYQFRVLRESSFGPYLRSPWAPCLRGKSLSVLESALMQNAPITRLESALPNSLDLKSFGIRTYENTRGRGSERLTSLPAYSLLATHYSRTFLSSLFSSQPRIESSFCFQALTTTERPMTEIRLHNTLSGQTEPFVPQVPGQMNADLGCITDGGFDIGHLPFVLSSISEKLLSLCSGICATVSG